MSKKAIVIGLGVASIILSRLSFFLINDPEGPNLLIVAVWAAIIFAGMYTVFTLGYRAGRSGK